MRSENFGRMDNLIESFPSELSLELFRKICLNRFFDMKVAEIYEKTPFSCPVYLGVGEESIAAALSIAFPSPSRIFAQHRCHGLYLSYGGNMEGLIDELLGLPTGCAGGMGGSASIHCPEIGMIGHDGFMGTQVPIGVGYAMATEKTTLVIMGDASAEEDYVLGALCFAATKKPPVLFICTDNGLSCLTPVCTRRNWNMVEHGTFGMPAIEITDDPWLIMNSIDKLSKNLPAFINIHTCRVSAHAGVTKDRIVTPEWDRFSLVKEGLDKLGLVAETKNVEMSIKDYINNAWHTRLEEVGRV